MKAIVIFISFILVTTAGYTLAYHQEAIAQVIYNSPNECVADLTSNPPKSSSGTPTPIQPQILNTTCANLAGMPGSLANVTGSFTNCMSYLTNHNPHLRSNHSMYLKSEICNNLNPP